MLFLISLYSTFFDFLNDLSIKKGMEWMLLDVLEKSLEHKERDWKERDLLV